MTDSQNEKIAFTPVNPPHCVWCKGPMTDRHTVICSTCLEYEQMGSTADAKQEDQLCEE